MRKPTNFTFRAQTDRLADFAELLHRPISMPRPRKPEMRHVEQNSQCADGPPRMQIASTASECHRDNFGFSRLQPHTRGALLESECSDP